MCAKKHNKNLFLFRFSFLKFWVLMFFSFVFVAQNGRSSEQGEPEKPLTKYDHASQLRESLPKPIVIEAPTYAPELLLPTNVATVQWKMTAIVDFISLSRDISLSNDQQSYPKLQQKHQEEAGKQSVSIKNSEELRNYLRDRSWKAISEKPTLIDYLRELRQKSDNLIDLAKKLLRQRDSFLEYDQTRNKIIEEILEENKKEEKKSETASKEYELITKFLEQNKEQQEKIDTLVKQCEIITKSSEQAKAQQEKIEALFKEHESIAILLDQNKLQQEQIEILSKEKESIKGLLEETKVQQQEKIEALSRESETIKGLNKLQQGQIEALSKEKESIEELLEKAKVEQQEKIEALSRENEAFKTSQKSNRFDKYIAPLATVALSALTASITTVCFLKYCRVQNH